MGTRHLICVFYRGRFVIAQYGQWDGYPENQGVTVVTFLLDPANIERLKQGLAHIYTPTVEEQDEIGKELNRQAKEHWAYDQMKCTYPSMSRDTGGKILQVVADATAEARVPVCLELDFIHDGCCEWAYVVDLDTEVLEVFHGLEKEREWSSERFKVVVDGAVAGRVPSLVKTFDFAELREKDSAFVGAMKEALR